VNLKKNAKNILRIRTLKAVFSRRFLMLCIMLCFLCSCASSLSPPNWEYQREAIDIHLKSDPQLNLQDGVPHTLLVCVYQLQNPIPFDRLASDTAGLYRLLECELFDPAVATSNRLFVHPGQDQHRAFDRAEGARHVAVVAGYYTIEKERIVKLIDIPVAIERSGFLWLKKRQEPQPVQIEIVLGRKQISSIKGK